MINRQIGLPNYPRINSAELSQLTLDAESGKRFEQRFLPGSMGGIALMFGGSLVSYVLSHFELLDEISAVILGLVCATLGICLTMWAYHRMLRALPRSVRTGNQMTPFILGDLEAPDHYEIAYIDETSGTYFRRRYIE